MIFYRVLTVGLCAALSGMAFAGPSVVLKPGKTEILRSYTASPTVTFAAEELSACLKAVLGKHVPVVTQPTEGRVAIVLGTNKWSEAAGIDLSGLKRDGYVMKTAPNRIYLAGEDDPLNDLKGCIKNGGGKKGCDPWWAQRGTYNAVIGFLEGYCGCRFYFPGELGTVLPPAKEIVVPETDRRDEPHSSVRYWSYWGMGKRFLGKEGLEFEQLQIVQRFRLRTDTGHMNVSEGQSRLSYPERFAKTHPEYFCLTRDGKRLSDSANRNMANYRASQFCYTSGVWEELYKDARSFFLKEDASVRGIVAANGKGYGWNQVGANERRYFDIQPQDGLIQCSCENCRKAYAGKGYYWARDVIWSNTVAIANRLKAEGIEGKLAQMAYGAYRDVPSFDIPDNVAVMVAERGPWSMPKKATLKAELDEIDRWSSKLHGNIWLWNYCGKFACFQFNIPHVPEFTPRAVGEYYRLVKDKVFGAFFEMETDNYLFSYFNCYVFCRMMWNPETDVGELIADHNRKMFGAAADEMGEVFATYEQKWLKEIAGRTKDTPLGPKPEVPSSEKLWKEVYSPAVLDRLETLYDAAAKKVDPQSLEGRRVALFRREMFEPLAKTGRDYVRKGDVGLGLKWNREHPELNLIRDDPKVGWYNGPRSVDTEVFLTAPHSFRLSTFKEKGVPVLHYLFTNKNKKPKDRIKLLKPMTRYRLSFCVKMDDVWTDRAGGDGGVSVSVEGVKGGTAWFPEGVMLNGTHDWMRQEYEFETTKKDLASAISLRLRFCRGTAWFDEIRLEEVGPTEECLKHQKELEKKETPDELTLDEE